MQNIIMSYLIKEKNPKTNNMNINHKNTDLKQLIYSLWIKYLTQNDRQRIREGNTTKGSTLKMCWCVRVCVYVLSHV